MKKDTKNKKIPIAVLVHGTTEANEVTSPRHKTINKNNSKESEYYTILHYTILQNTLIFNRFCSTIYKLILTKPNGQLPFGGSKGRLGRGTKLFCIKSTFLVRYTEGRNGIFHSFAPK
ncbi:hypothetical protein PHYBLDRAFT_60213 [Phycomyces blakesleeanus NRRL 1555(-)]|uniref:Uncharacterized protein n=1 Tax=Phycomyces blakesleeanus (strain ATCC 8743b / DSM 1359 / FGSC 10004 / NBRC 33097 / NRRL 1555) TaxID=763407 RepID=A0A163A0W3_PHYB8|nr:hypothetical protein PHYBLDRAFT_60213 [Phycomyces blakesleeanus NRRL 1555(-)]OAD70311.1 hypothetical protein PHYBLDRAFT_60213 [Phycomyces blakesleeanus NRRL 1555(-)]|eukprot:XP_018288351.1 hypothetical protein PHYBLDRAFT_60213 [Phycomyces blakesleeanus NRRL 1555(-)]